MHRVTFDPNICHSWSMHSAVNKSVITIKETESALAAARLMKETETGCLLVVDGDGKLTGILTGRDLVLNILAPNEKAEELRVKQVMTRQPMTARVDQVSLRELAKTLGRGRVRRLPVVDAANRPVGIITLEDMLVHSADVLHSCAAAVSPYLTLAPLRSSIIHRD